MLGGIFAALSEALGSGVLIAGFLGFAAIFAWFSAREAEHDQNFSVTGVVAGLIVFALGALAVVGDTRTAAAGGAALAAVLASREVLHDLLRRLTWIELRSAMILAVMTAIVLPLLPDRAIDPWGGLNPFEIWFFTVVIAAISFGGYVAVRVLGQPRRTDVGIGRMSRLHTEKHLVSRIGWLRAAVLGANDGIVSTASLIVGVAAAAQGTSEILVAGIAGLVAGSMSMAAGEYVSVSSQSDTEQADLARERMELETQPEFEKNELAQIYVGRGLSDELAQQVAAQLMARDALGAHARDELGLSEATTARPIQAALTSAATFAVGAAMPLAMVLLAPAASLVWAVSAASLLFLAFLGAIGAKAGGANVMRATWRVTFWGALAMGLTAGIGALVGQAV